MLSTPVDQRQDHNTDLVDQSGIYKRPAHSGSALHDQALCTEFNRKRCNYLNQINFCLAEEA